MITVDIDHLRQWVGRTRSIEDALHPFPAQALAATLDRSGGIGSGDALPPGWQWLYFLEAGRASAIGPDGHPVLTGEFLPPVPLQRRMWAAGAMDLLHPLVLGRPASRTSIIRDVSAKSGKGGEMVFVTLEHQLSQDGRLCLREHQSLVYRALPTQSAPLPPGDPAPGDAQFSQEIRPDPVLLFRYSALTFNGHRIHYDRPYAVEQEFYPALVVHGPLLATLLLELLGVQVRDRQLVSFQFRAVRPTFDSRPFNISGKRDGDDVALWSTDADGFVCVTATAKLG